MSSSHSCGRRGNTPPIEGPAGRSAAGRFVSMEVFLNARQDGWAAARALAEGAAADAELLARAMGRARDTVRRRAKAEGWKWAGRTGEQREEGGHVDAGPAAKVRP